MNLKMFERATTLAASVGITYIFHPLSYWDTSSESWVTADGDYRIYVGSSVADIALIDSVHVSQPPRTP